MTQNHVMAGADMKGPSNPKDEKIDFSSVLLDRINARTRARKAAQANSINVLPGQGDGPRPVAAAEIDQFLKEIRNAGEVDGDATVSKQGEMHKVKKEKHNDMDGIDSEVKDSNKKKLKEKELNNDVKNNEGEDRTPKKKMKKHKHKEIDSEMISGAVAGENESIVCHAQITTPKKKKRDSLFKETVQSSVSGNYSIVQGRSTDGGEMVKKKKKKEYQGFTVHLNEDIGSLNCNMNNTHKSEGSQVEELCNEAIGKTKKRKRIKEDDNKVTDETIKTDAFEGKDDTSPKSPTKKKKKLGVPANTDNTIEHKNGKEIISNLRDFSEHFDQSKDGEKSEKTKKKSKNQTRKHRRERLRAKLARHKEIGGFTVLGQVFETTTKEKLHRILPHWLAHPSILELDLKEVEGNGLEAVAGLASWLKQRLELVKIVHFFPVQRAFIPELLATSRHLTTRYRPRDICVSAPTGSGKTLAYVLPLLQLLSDRIVTRIRAIILLPVKELALQVYKVFMKYRAGSGLHVGLAASLQTIANEQALLVDEDYRGWHSKVDILIATPSRLLDHLTHTPGINLSALRYLVLDEADNMLREKGGELMTRVEQALKVQAQGNLPPPHRLLFSATLSLDPELLQHIELYHPRLFTIGSRTSDVATGTDKKVMVGQYVRPTGLVEEYVVVDENIKPLALYHLICGGTNKERMASQVKDGDQDIENGQEERSCKGEEDSQGKEKTWRRVLIFTNSVLSTHRLAVLLSILAPDLRVAEFYSSMKEKRKQIVNQFLAGKIDILVSSDAIARGLDIPNIDYVVSYDVTTVNTYIHRIGRTARAGRPGTAVSLVTMDTVKEFMQGVKSSGGEARKMTLNTEELETYEERYVAALASMKKALWEEEQERRERLRATKRKFDRRGNGNRIRGHQGKNKPTTLARA